MVLHVQFIFMSIDDQHFPTFWLNFNWVFQAETILTSYSLLHMGKTEDQITTTQATDFLTALDSIKIGGHCSLSSLLLLLSLSLSLHILLKNQFLDHISYLSFNFAKVKTYTHFKKKKTSFVFKAMLDRVKGCSHVQFY